MKLIRAYGIPVEACRGGTVESVHTVMATVCAIDSDLATRDRMDRGADSRYAVPVDDLPSIWIRSTAKPFQLLPLLMHPTGAAIREEPRDLAICVASHDGTSSHAARVRGILERYGISQHELRCGVHRPYFLQQLNASAPEHAQLYDELHNNCSGNHAAMLLWARACGVAPGAYLDLQCAAQRMVHDVVRAASGCEPHIAVDNCGAPCYQLPLAALAQAYLSLVSSAQVRSWNEERRQKLGALGTFAQVVDTLQCIGTAMATQPRWVSGETTEATRLAERFPDTLVIKHGAEGVLCVANRQRQASMALKVLDGNPRALFPALLQLMQELGWWDDVAEPLFTELSRPVLKGPPGHAVGELRVAAPHTGKPPIADVRTPAV